ncbi:hypothetical protein PybrP1_008395 [[Pythium] brassicae (nom. inval.)]|nr:hypothetical protein PybrP1_008395 [[Pythium] brassicae (nom. inval.)]
MADLEMPAARGTLSVALARVAWRCGAVATPSPPLWVVVQLAGLERFWFPPDDDNACTVSVALADGDCDADFEYQQSSRALPLARDTVEVLAAAQLQLLVFCGDSRARETDALLGELRLPLVGVVLGETLEQRVVLEAASTADYEHVEVDVCVQLDANLADFVTGCRVLRLRALSVLSLPKEWTLPSESDDDALRVCAAPDRNLATYELEIRLPAVASQSSVDDAAVDTIVVSGGKLQYEPATESRIAVAATEDEAEVAAGAAGLTGAWRIAFSEPAEHTRVYLKDAVERLKDFLSVEKHVGVTLRRTYAESTAKVPETSTASVRMYLSDLVRPGATVALVSVAIDNVRPVAKEALEQELAGVSSADEKKKLQAALAEYESTTQQAAAVSSALAAAGTRLEATIEVLNAPLVLQPPLALVYPAASIEELISPRDLLEERERQENPLADLRAELRRVVLTLLHEYEAASLSQTPAFSSDMSAPDAVDASRERDERKQQLIFRLNTHGIYHNFKEALKKRVVPVIRDRFARSEFAAAASDSDSINDTDSSGRGAGDGPANATANVNATTNTEYFGRLYTLVMREVHAVLHEVVYADLDALEQTSASALGRPTPGDIAAVLDELKLKALENQVVGDAAKSERLHLDRIAFAEQAHTRQSAAPPHGRQDTLHVPSPHALESVWYDYARFSLAQSDLDTAGASLRQSLSLNARALPALLTTAALLCELRDFVRAESVAKASVAEALAAYSAAPTGLSVALAHALLALYFVQSGRDVTGNLTLFELLKAQQALQRDGAKWASACVGSVWLCLAEFAHELSLRVVTRAALQLSDASRKPRDVLSSHERVTKRAVEAELALLAGDADHAAKLLHDALAIDPSHPLAWLVLARAYTLKESASEPAVECLRRALEARARLPSDALRLGLFVHLGLALLQASQFADAEAVFLQACSDGFRVASSWLGVGIACLRQEKWAAAHVALAEANRLDAANADVWGYLALLALSAPPLVRAPEEAAAKRFVAQALRHELRNPALLRELSNGFVAIDRLEDAEKLLRRSLACQESSLTRKTLADVLAAQNCAEDALRQYQQALAASAGVSERCALLEACAKLLTTLGRPDAAAEYRGMAAQFLIEQQLEQQEEQQQSQQQQEHKEVAAEL